MVGWMGMRLGVRITLGMEVLVRGMVVPRIIRGVLGVVARMVLVGQRHFWEGLLRMDSRAMGGRDDEMVLGCGIA